MPSKSEIIEYLLKNVTDNDLSDPKFFNVNEDNWTIADLFCRQWLNNGWDGFGMVNVRECYKYLVKHKELLVEYNLLNKDGYNNFGFALWKDYDIPEIKEVDESHECDELEEECEC